MVEEFYRRRGSGGSGVKTSDMIFSFGASRAKG